MVVSYWYVATGLIDCHSLLFYLSADPQPEVGLCKALSVAVGGAPLTSLSPENVDQKNSLAKNFVKWFIVKKIFNFTNHMSYLQEVVGGLIDMHNIHSMCGMGYNHVVVAHSQATPNFQLCVG